MRDSATVFYFKAFELMSNIRISPDSYLFAGGEKYDLISAKGITLGEWFRGDRKGNASFELFFEPIPSKLKEISFLEGEAPGDFKFYNIDLTGERPAKTKVSGKMPAHIPELSTDSGLTTVEVDLGCSLKGLPPISFRLMNSPLIPPRKKGGFSVDGTFDDSGKAVLRFYQNGVYPSFLMFDNGNSGVMYVIGNDFYTSPGETVRMTVDAGYRYLTEERFGLKNGKKALPFYPKYEGTYSALLDCGDYLSSPGEYNLLTDSRLSRDFPDGASYVNLLKTIYKEYSDAISGDQALPEYVKEYQQAQLKGQAVSAMLDVFAPVELSNEDFAWLGTIGLNDTKIVFNPYLSLALKPALFKAVAPEGDGFVGALSTLGPLTAKAHAGEELTPEELALFDKCEYPMFKKCLERIAVEAAEATYDPDLFAEKALIDQLGQAIEDTRNCNDPFALGDLNVTIDDLTSQITTSASQYAELITARNLATNLINDDNLKDAAMAYAQAWISETDVIAPNDNDYPVGNFGYIKANRQLTGQEAKAEASRFNDYLLANVKTVDDPIYATYTTIVDANGFNDGEKGHSLVDGNKEDTKWCASTDHKPWRLIFKSDEPIKPTYYGLVTGGDTAGNPDRNWKTWKIWAANFDSDEEAKDEESEKWVLIDEKTNIGTDVLKTANKFESYLNLSIGCSEPYQYFKLVIEASGGSLQQMNELTFYNQGNMEECREDFVAEFADYDPLESPAYKGYTDEFAAKYTELQTTVSAPDLMRLKNELVDLQEVIATSVAKYEEYVDWCTQLSNEGPASEELQAWFEGYTTENVAPNDLFANGTQAYIMENLQLDNEAIGAAAGWDIRYDDNGKETGRKEILPSGEIGYIQSMVKAVTDGTYILLGGHTEGQWGDGFYGHLIDGIALNTTEVDPETGKETKVNATKWGGQADANGNTYIIFRTAGKTNPFFYTLTTGNDTGTYQGRNWGTWYIYGL